MSATPSVGQRRPAQGGGQEPQRVHSYALSLGASLSARLAYFAIRFLKLPQRQNPRY